MMILVRGTTTNTRVSPEVASGLAPNEESELTVVLIWVPTRAEAHSRIPRVPHLNVVRLDCLPWRVVLCIDDEWRAS